MNTKYEVKKGNNESFTMTYDEVIEKFTFNENFSIMFKRLALNESMYHYDSKIDFKRIQ